MSSFPLRRIKWSFSLLTARPIRGLAGGLCLTPRQRRLSIVCFACSMGFVAWWRILWACCLVPIPASHPNTIGSSSNHPCPLRSMLRLVCRPPWDYTNMLAHERCRDQSVLETFLYYSSSLTPWFSVVILMNQSLENLNDETFGYQKITHIRPSQPIWLAL